MDNNKKKEELSKHFGSSQDEFENLGYYDEEYYEKIRLRIKERRKIAERKRVRRNRLKAAVILCVAAVAGVKIFGGRSEDAIKIKSEPRNDSSVVQTETVPQKSNEKPKAHNESKALKNKTEKGYTIEHRDGMTFVDGLLVVNKTYSLPSDYNPGVTAVANNVFEKMQSAAYDDGINLFINSGFRSYREQKLLYDSYKDERGQAEADKVSSRPGHSEHQTGLTFDVVSTDDDFQYTEEAKWLAAHCSEYGFIIRYPKGKEKYTGYIYEPWHIRYVGVEKAKKITESGLSLEEYYGITSDYKYANSD